MGPGNISETEQLLGDLYEHLYALERIIAHYYSSLLLLFIIYSYLRIYVTISILFCDLVISRYSNVHFFGVRILPHARDPLKPWLSEALGSDVADRVEKARCQGDLC